MRFDDVERPTRGPRIVAEMDGEKKTNYLLLSLQTVMECPIRL
jgi:hypothetical protein